MRDRLHYYAQGRLTNNCSCCIRCYILHHTFTTEADALLREDCAMTKTEFATAGAPAPGFSMESAQTGFRARQYTYWGSAMKPSITELTVSGSELRDFSSRN